MPSFYSPTGNLEIWQEKPDGYFTTEEWAAEHPVPVTEISLEDLKAAKKVEIANARYKAEIAGITFNGTTIKTDRESQALITGAALAALQDSAYSCKWKTEQGFITLTAAQIIAVADAVRAHVQDCFDTESSLAAAIDAAESVIELETIAWPEVS